MSGSVAVLPWLRCPLPACAMRSLLLAWAIALLYCDGVESFVRRTGQASGTPGFVAGAVAFHRKRPRGSRQGASSSQTPLAAAAGSFTARTAKSQSNWLEVAGEGRRRTQRRTGGGHGTRMLFGLHFQPPEFSVWLHGTVQAVMLGGFAALIPKVTAERIREKEEGMVRDEDYAAGLWDDEEDFDEYGHAGGYVCPTCDNTNQVKCSECGGKGFFVSASAMPKKCTYCDGLGTFDCEDCEERREMLRRERGRDGLRGNSLLPGTMTSRSVDDSASMTTLEAWESRYLRAFVDLWR